MNIKKDEELKEKVSIMSFANSYAKCTKQKEVIIRFRRLYYSYPFGMRCNLMQNTPQFESKHVIT